MNDENTTWYRTGAVAKMLDTSPHTIRELARAGLIESQVRKGYRYIPAREVERLQAEGLPPMPASTDLNAELSEPDGEESVRPTRTRAAPAGLYGEPSDQLIRSKETVIRAQHSQELRAMQKARKEEEARARRAQQIERWRDSYRRMAAAAAHGEILADLLHKVDSLLDTVPPLSDVNAHVHQLIDAEMRPIRDREGRERALSEYRQRIQRTVETITTASLGYWDAEGDEPEEARELASSALAALPPESSDLQMRGTLTKAIAPVVERIAHRRAQKERANKINILLLMLPALHHSSAGDRDRMNREVRAALETLPLSARTGDLDAIVERIVAPFRTADQQSEAAQKKQREADAAASNANFSWMLYRDHIDTRLGQLEKKERLTFDGWSDRRELYENLERKIKPLIISEVLKDSNMPVAQLKERIAALVDRHYKEFCD